MKKIKIVGPIFLIIVTLLVLFFTTGCSINFSWHSTPADRIDTDLIERVYALIQANFIDPDRVDAQALTEGALRGMMEALGDPYSSYMNQAQYEAMQRGLSGTFEGIGAYVGLEDGTVTIIAPIPGTPADKAGITPGDKILEINGQSTAGMTPNDAALIIRGPRGTPVNLTILKKDTAEVVNIEIIRATIEVPTVNLEIIDGIARIVITNFAQRTEEELKTILQTVLDERVEGIIIDLRNNPGGYLDVCVRVSSYFLDSGTVVSVKDRVGNTRTSSVYRVSPKMNLPVVVLVNRYSASASEVFSGALQDHNRATIAGELTYGKGSVNNLIDLPDNRGIYLTIAHWYTPNGNLIEGEGITPDVLLDFNEVDGVQWAIDYLKSQN